MTTLKYWEFPQNNSGGSFDIDDARGIGPRVWIEATTVIDAVQRAKRVGIYFNGCDKGMDCSCCGDRWYEPWKDYAGKIAPEISEEYDFIWHGTVYVHHIDGTIERINPATQQVKAVLG